MCMKCLLVKDVAKYAKRKLYGYECNMEELYKDIMVKRRYLGYCDDDNSLTQPKKIIIDNKCNCK